MAKNIYNGTAADVELIPAGTELYRIRRATIRYAANSFNPTPKPLGDRQQGRFEPTDRALGGYLYVAKTQEGAVAEGVLRNNRIPPTRVVPRLWLSGKAFAVLRLNEDIEAAAVYGRHTAKLDLDTSFLCSTSRRYSRTRTTGTAILINTPTARALAYPCRNCESETALMLIDRGAALSIDVQSEAEILKDKATAQLVFDTLEHRFGLKYTGKRP